MDSSLLIFPMAAMVLLTLIVGGFLMVARVQGLRSGQIKMRYFKTLQEGEPTEAMTKASRHFINLFEVPVLFYVICLAAIALQIQSPCLVPLAWAFVAFRTIQAFVHLGPNKVVVRMSVYLLGFTAVLAMWVDVVWRRLG